MLVSGGPRKWVGETGSRMCSGTECHFLSGTHIFYEVVKVLLVVGAFDVHLPARIVGLHQPGLGSSPASLESFEDGAWMGLLLGSLGGFLLLPRRQGKPEPSAEFGLWSS